MYYFNFFVKSYLSTHSISHSLKYFFLFFHVPSVFDTINGYPFQFNTTSVFIYFFKQETGKGFFKRTDPVEFSFDLTVVGSEDEKRVEVTFLSIHVFIGLDLFKVVWDTSIL